MKIAIMQPYFFPYIGYYELISEVDYFVIYDDVQYTKKGWINRNYLDSKAGPWLFSIPIQNSSAIELICTKVIAPEFDRKKLVNKIKQNYGKLTSPSKLNKVEEIIMYENDNLFDYLRNSIQKLSVELGLDCRKILVSSEIGDFSTLKGEEKVLGICAELGADQYLNPPSGRTLYNSNTFEQRGIELHFQKPLPPTLNTQNQGVQYLSVLHSYFMTKTLFLNSGGE